MKIGSKRHCIQVGTLEGKTFPLTPNKKAIHGRCVDDPRMPEHAGKESLSPRIRRIRISEDKVIAEALKSDFLLVDVPVEKSSILADEMGVELVRD